MSDEISPLERAKAGYPLFDETLCAFTPSREVAARGMGLSYPFIGEDGHAALKSKGFYPAQLQDTIIATWICSLKNSIDLTPEEARAKPWTPTKAMLAPVAAMEAAIEWAEQKGFASVMSPKFIEATLTAQQIIQDYTESKFVVESSEPIEPGNL